MKTALKPAVIFTRFPLQKTMPPAGAWSFFIYTVSTGVIHEISQPLWSD
jgi:hypothetical protein